MGTGAITGYIDLAQLVLYGFWIFFFTLVAWLIYESKREGFPLDSGLANGRRDPGILPMPRPKRFRTQHYGDFFAPHDRDWKQPPVAAEPVAPFPCAPIEPTGNPMLDGVGPGAWTDRMDKPDLTFEGDIRIAPLRDSAGFSVEHGDIDPRGMKVFGADGVAGGKVADLWVDRSEHLFRYLEVTTKEGAVLVPMNLVRVSRKGVDVQSILGGQFAAVPKTKKPNQVTLLEEEKIFGYFGGGTLYAEPGRQEPLL